MKTSHPLFEGAEYLPAQALAAKPEDDWLWCSCCTRVYLHGMFRLVGEGQKCPYKDCPCDTVKDSKPWATTRDQSNYPAMPAFGSAYPLLKH